MQKFLLDTNILFELEDDHSVHPEFSELLSLASKYRADIFVHESAREDIDRDRNKFRRRVSLSKLEKYQVLSKARNLSIAKLEQEFGSLPKPNDKVDATLLHSLNIGAADFLVTQDRGLHERARRHSSQLGRRVLDVLDAVELLRTTYGSKKRPVRYVKEVSAHTILLSEEIFSGLRDDYSGFDSWWTEKCVRDHRQCFIVEDDGVLSGLVVLKEEEAPNTDAVLSGEKILKLCTFKVLPQKRGAKLGELLLKKVFWHSQANNYNVVYLSTYKKQERLIALLEYFGFQRTTAKPDGELICEKEFSSYRLYRKDGESVIDTDRLNYPRFVSGPDISAFVVPIKEDYHDTLFPDLKRTVAIDLFEAVGQGPNPEEPGNTIRKVYLSKAQSKLGPPGSLLFFYKSKSDVSPSQAITVLGVLEDMELAYSTDELLRFVGGRSVYTKTELAGWKASKDKPVKVINFLLSGYIDPSIGLQQLLREGIFTSRPPQSISSLEFRKLQYLLSRSNLGFDL